MGNGIGVPVAAGLAAGIAFIFLFSTFFAQSYSSPIESVYTPMPGQFRDAAIKIATQNSTLQELLGGRDVVVSHVRDWGVSHATKDCPINRCAIVLFADRVNPGASVFSALVNIQSAKVVDITTSQGELISKTKELEEVKSFLGKYPDATIETNRYRSHAEVVYSVQRAISAAEGLRYPDIHTLSLWIETTHWGEVIDVYAECGGAMTERVTADIVQYIETTDCLYPDRDSSSTVVPTDQQQQQQHYYDLQVNNQTYRIGYSFSQGDEGRIDEISLHNDTRIILFVVSTPQDSRLTIDIPTELFEYFYPESANHGADLEVFIDGTPGDLQQITDGSMGYVTFVMPVEQGAEEIELVGTWFV